ncbi:transporter substrate-binding domain-containing protein [Paraglaciecola aquimarina]|uniref:Transporter substrate-binding domain-containing protein n=1 Tax=Paraglaciecola algarum TaxID=3050085 RepID=A0ABS9D234_9ALTE|nr:transporter substrate-binding domain-containing protein [Paraglaciecola sp. G1-23]MCF2946977.1 transporter substrate-binding domain-containing protein [Paraglaciecola sp. G1-23]
MRYLLILVVTFCTNIAYATSIKHTAPLQANDVQKDYFILLLKKVCEQIKQHGSPCELEPVSLPMLQQRQLTSLNKGLLDIVWTVTTKEREKEYLAVKIPLMKGLIGARIAVLNNQHQNLFNNPNMFPKIKQLRLAQGHDWPDVSILRENGYHVVETSWYKLMYRDIAKNLYDYSLRGVFEIYSEYSHFKQDNLTIDNSYLFYYPSAIYFFVKRDNQNLAAKVYTALLAMISSGDFDKLLYQYPAHKTALEKAALNERKVIRLKNSLLPSSAPLNNKSLWFQFNK